jgi:hypothetical protein
MTSLSANAQADADADAKAMREELARFKAHRKEHGLPFEDRFVPTYFSNMPDLEDKYFRAEQDAAKAKPAVRHARLPSPKLLTADHLEKRLGQSFEEIGKFVGDVLADDIVPLITALQARLTELEQTALRDGGIFSVGKAYAPGSVVSHSGSLWVAKCDTTGVRPGTGSNWRMMLKRGEK